MKYVKRAFLPLRQFRDLTDANAQLRDWVLGEAGNRIHGTTREQPLAQFEAVEKALMRPLPDVPPELAVWAKVKVHRDAHVQFRRPDFDEFTLSPVSAPGADSCEGRASPSR